jgi:flagellar biosynthesis/type III secretory pathway protein FliH
VGATLERADEQQPLSPAALPAAPKSTPEPPTPLTATHTTPASPSTNTPKPDLTKELQADRARIDELFGKVRASVNDLRKDQAERIRQWQRAAIELAVTISTRVLHERIEADAFPIEAKVRDMLNQLEGDVPVKIRLNPTDLDLLRRKLGGKPLLDGPDDPNLVADPSLARGDCCVEGKEAMLLSDLGRELVEIREELLRSLAHARS